MINEQLPIWISIVFLLVIPIPVYMVIQLIAKGSGSKQLTTAASIGFIAYFAYVGIACFQGAFEEETLPPKIIMTMIPLLIAYLAIFFFSKTFRIILEDLNTSDIVSVHIFRLIGSFFLILMWHNALPRSIGLIAGIGDIITAVSSIYVVKAIRDKKPFAKNLTLIWNTFGLFDILATTSTAFILTKIAIEQGFPGVETLASFPFCYIPAFAPATIIFLHLCIYRKALGEKQLR
jgi:hypothetical protein